MRLPSSWSQLVSPLRVAVIPRDRQPSAGASVASGRRAAPHALPGERLVVGAVNFSASLALARRNNGTLIRISLSDVPWRQFGRSALMWSEMAFRP